jgi:hypothetical protein
MRTASRVPDWPSTNEWTFFATQSSGFFGRKSVPCQPKVSKLLKMAKLLLDTTRGAEELGQEDCRNVDSKK